MNTYRRSLVNIFLLGLIWLILGTGLVTAQISTTAPAGKLILSLQSSLDRDGSIKAASITKAEISTPDGLFTVNNKTFKAATIIGGIAQFDLSGLAPGDYFIRVNGLDDDLVPTRIDDPNATVNQYVGQKLRESVIGNLSDPSYRIETFSKGQGKHPVVGYSDGAALKPERYAYVILSLKTSPQKFEVRILGSTRVIPTAAEINSYTPSMATHPSTSISANPPFSTWMFSESDHADNYNGTDSNCNACHLNIDTKPATFSGVMVNNGWCFRCHYGKEGVDYGFIDTTALAAVTPTPITAIATSVPATATRTPKAPAFEALLAISALFVAILVRRR